MKGVGNMVRGKNYDFPEILNPHPPTPEFLTKDFPSAASSRMDSLTKENLVGARDCLNFAYRAIPVAIVSQNAPVLVFMGYGTMIARCVMGYRTCADVPA